MTTNNVVCLAIQSTNYWNVLLVRNDNKNQFFGMEILSVVIFKLQTNYVLLYLLTFCSPMNVSIL